MSWRTNLYALTSAQFFIFVAFGFVSPFQALYIRELGVSDLNQVVLWSGGISFVQALVLAIFSPIWGSFADRYGRRLMLLRVAFGGGTIFASMGLAQNVYQFASSRAR
ncbi:MAG: MFS transporter [Chloroflexi bacterium]|nr:MFS transporter [Chloroflexota bacterium]